MAKVLALVLMLIAGSAALGKEAAPAAQDPALEQRVTALTSELRCLVCQNQTIADSNAGLAVDLRNEVREKMKQGMSDREIIDFMVERYGDFVLYRPPFKATTLLLWLGPLALFGAAASAATVYFRRTYAAPPAAPLSDQERARLAELLGTSQPGKGEKE